MAKRAGIVAKVRKLLALANNNKNLNEALAAAEAAQKLITDYKIDLEKEGNASRSKEVLEYLAFKGTYFGPKRPAHWIQILAEAIAQSNECRTFLTRARLPVKNGYEEFPCLSLVGTEENIEIVEELFGWFISQIVMLCGMETEKTKETSQDWAADFCLGAAIKLGEKLLKQQQAQMANAAGGTITENKFGIARINENKKAVDDFINGLSTEKQGLTKAKDSRAWVKGFIAGDKLNIGKEKKIDSGLEKKMLSKG